jgi:hypothetical protein
LNLAGEANKEIIDCYSPAKVVKAREYHEEKEAFKMAEEEAKLQRKIQRAANALRNKQDKAVRVAKAEARAVQAQLKRDLVATNKAAKKALQKKPDCTTSKAKKATLTMLIQRKVSTKARAPTKVRLPKVVVAPIEEVVEGVVAAEKSGRRTITLPQRFR